tara:strand:- start:380 stop:622 length:243 start_codon:yes stop_codon:yes gene_type:complete
MPSDIIAALPVIAEATNFVTAIRLLPIRAAIITFFDPEAIMRLYICEVLACGKRGIRTDPHLKREEIQSSLFGRKAGTIF